MTQEYLILVLFILATSFIARKIYKEFTAKNGCPKGCGNCEIADSKTI